MAVFNAPRTVRRDRPRFAESVHAIAGVAESVRQPKCRSPLLSTKVDGRMVRRCEPYFTWRTFLLERVSLSLKS